MFLKEIGCEDVGRIMLTLFQRRALANTAMYFEFYKRWRYDSLSNRRLLKKDYAS
jgi:hypothetical protein